MDTNNFHYNDQTLQVLAIAVAQIEAVLTDGNESVSTLTKHFIELASKLDDIAKQSPQALNADFNQINQDVHEAIVAFQFYDRISQRLTHVSSALSHIYELIESENLRDDPEAWQNCRDRIEAGLSMQTEKDIFRLIISGAPIDEVLKQSLNKPADTDESTDNDIEFF